MKVLVTGGLGFLGRHVVAALVDARCDVRIISRGEMQAVEGSELFSADLLKASDLERAFCGVDVVVHLAASLEGAPEQVINNTLMGTRRLLDAMTRSGTDRLVLASSFSVYDWTRIEGYLDEKSPILDFSSSKPLGPYAFAKTLQESLVRDVAHENGWTLTVLRPAAIWGGGMWADFLLGPRLGPFQIVFAPTANIRLCYVENAADAFALAAQRTTGSQELILNVIDNPEATTWQHAKLVTEQLGGLRVAAPYSLTLESARALTFLVCRLERIPYFADPLRFEALHKPVAWSNQRLFDTLGWAPRFNYSQAVEQAAELS